MKKIIIVVLFFWPLLAMAQQKINPPSKGKAVVYFIQTPGTLTWINFRYFERGNFIGKFNGSNFMRYECDPGETLFWVKAENLDFIEAELKEGSIYFIEATPTLGAITSAVKFKLVNYSDEKQMKRIMKVIENNEGVAFAKSELDNAQNEMQKVINESSRKIQVKRKRKKKVKYLTLDMTYEL